MSELQPKYPQVGQVVWIWYGQGPKPVAYMGRRGSWTQWRQGDRQWFARGPGRWHYNPVACAWDEFSRRTLAAGTRAKSLGMPEREVNGVFEAAAAYVRAFADQFKVPASEAWTHPGGKAPGGAA